MMIMEMLGAGTKLTNSNDEKVSDHDMIIGIDRDICWVKIMLTNHLKYHESRDKLLLTVSITSIGALLVTIGTLAFYIIKTNG